MQLAAALHQLHSGNPLDQRDLGDVRLGVPPGELLKRPLKAVVIASTLRATIPGVISAGMA
eukprot:4717485-Amphidinium_carterae.1